MSAVAVASLNAGVIFKAMLLARRRNFEAVEVRVSYDDYFDLRGQSMDAGPYQHCMQFRSDGRWTIFGVLIDFEHPPGTPAELTLKYRGRPTPFRAICSDLATALPAKAEACLGSIHKEPIQ